MELCLELKRKNIQAIDICRVKKNYDSLYHLLSQSPWDEEELNEKRLELIQKDRRIRTFPKRYLRDHRFLLSFEKSTYQV